MKKGIIFLGMLMLMQSTIAQEYTPTQENLEARKWFQEAKFGLFIHWGVYSQLGDGEWVMNNQNIPIDTYEKLPAFFNPTAYDADEWVRMANISGEDFQMFEKDLPGKNTTGFGTNASDIGKLPTEVCETINGS